MDSNEYVIGEQLLLFQDKDMLLNRGALELKRLNLDEAKKAFQRYKELYKDGDNIDNKLKITEFLIQGFKDAPRSDPDEAVYLYKLWKAFQSYMKSIDSKSEIFVSEVKSSFFQKLLKAIDQYDLSDAPYLYDNVPMGYVYMQASKYDIAVKSLQACILTTPDNAAIYGYLGDSYILRGDPVVARYCYLEACLISPAEIDWDHVKDKEIRDLREQLIETFDMNKSLATEWLPSYAYIQGLFRPKSIKINEGLKEFVDEYLALKKAYLKEQTSELRAKLFIRGIILCDNEPFLRLIKKIDFVDIRRQMKEMNPSLFSRYMKCIESSKG